MTNLIIEKLLAKSRRTDLPTFAPGDTIRVQVKIKEGDKERLQAFEGVVIKRTRGQQYVCRLPIPIQNADRLFWTSYTTALTQSPS